MMIGRGHDGPHASPLVDQRVIRIDDKTLKTSMARRNASSDSEPAKSTMSSRHWTFLLSSCKRQLQMSLGRVVDEVSDSPLRDSKACHGPLGVCLRPWEMSIRVNRIST